MSYQSPLPLLIERLKTLTELKKVLGMVTLDAMLQQALPSPSCFVYRSTDKAVSDVSGDLGRATQTIKRYYSVLLVYANIKVIDETTPFLADELNQKVIDLILGWQPCNEYPFMFVSADSMFEQNLYIRENVFVLEECFDADYRSV
jgi:hypothetical protein